ncbi:hypothetical protein ASE86_14655 [Sphingomonas sp. Leaf33]|uniref:hypothetical protein n=1 Tax=Sphingomonas sp. Leaf33 TaxID=1736215 RepID=UPI0007008263|nr:hypothetical protein [Sphingomonas sp. Leaf33]KQN21212.1 hypothetical protein ASE86_14655 [Sphingomonas sp. Leaf33]
MRSRGVAYDRIIDADRPVIGAVPCETADAAAIRIRWHAPVAAPPVERPVWTRAADALWFDPPGVARYRCTADTIDVTPVAGGASDMVDALLVATALPAVLWLDGAVVLHAAAVVPSGAARALAIAGPSGRGKSHLAAALVARGGAFVADDSIAVRLRGDAAVCAGLAGGYHLGAADADARPFHPIGVDRTRRAAALGTLVILDDVAGYARLTGVAAVAALLANRHRASVPRLCGIEPRVLADMARLASAVRVYRWSADEADALRDDAILAQLMSDEGAR